MEVRRLKNDELQHHGIKGQKWGERNYQNPDGSLTAEGRKRYLINGRKQPTSTGKSKGVKRRKNSKPLNVDITASGGYAHAVPGITPQHPSAAYHEQMESLHAYQTVGTFPSDAQQHAAMQFYNEHGMTYDQYHAQLEEQNAKKRKKLKKAMDIVHTVTRALFNSSILSVDKKILSIGAAICSNIVNKKRS